MKKPLLATLGILAVTTLTGCISTFSTTDSDTTQDGTLNVVASFYPMAYFATQVGGEFAHVTNLTPAGVEPHDHELTPDQIIAIHNSQLLVLNGSGLEPWSNDVLADVPSSVNVVSASDGLATLEGEDHEHAHEEDEHHEEEEAVTDPHVWLSPKLAKIQVQKITDAFIKADPIHADAYTTHSQTLQDRLAELDAEYEVGLAQCTSRVIITAHTAFAYLASTYGLEQLSIAGLTPDAEPSLSELGEIADFALQNNVQYIFFESLVSPKLSETIAREVGAQTLVLNPLEGLTDEQIADGQDYFTVMRENLTNLRTALQCQ